MSSDLTLEEKRWLAEKRQKDLIAKKSKDLEQSLEEKNKKQREIEEEEKKLQREMDILQVQQDFQKFGLFRDVKDPTTKKNLDKLYKTYSIAEDIISNETTSLVEDEKKDSLTSGFSWGWFGGLGKKEKEAVTKVQKHFMEVLGKFQDQMDAMYLDTHNLLINVKLQPQEPMKTATKRKAEREVWAKASTKMTKLAEACNCKGDNNNESCQKRCPCARADRLCTKDCRCFKATEGVCKNPILTRVYAIEESCSD